jgi:hypothetical protein
VAQGDENKPWGKYEGSHVDPDGNIIRFGSPTRKDQSLGSGISGRFCTRNWPRATILPSSSRSISMSQICCVRPV